LSGLATSAILAILLTSALPALPVVAARGGVKVKAGEVTTSVDHQRLVRLPFDASHVTLHWSGAPDAKLTIAFGQTPSQLGEEVQVGLDEDGVDGAEAYGQVLWTGGARFARVTTDRPIGRLTVVAIDSRDRRASGLGAGSVADAAVPQPGVISRAGWGADESIRFDGSGAEKFPPAFFPLQKLIVHHTAGRNNDPDPEATIRAIYYDHAVLRGYGDIDYNFLIDAQGRVYEGRHSREYGPGEPITAEDLAGNVVRGSHARDYNAGTVGIVLLGNFTSVQPPTAQRTALVNLLAWKAERHGVDPKGSGNYVNPETGDTTFLNNISGHRNVNATACPGDAFYATFASLRQAVADRIAATTGPAHDSTAPTVQITPLLPNPTGALHIPFGLIFSEPITGLDAADFGVAGTSPGWVVESVTGKASTYTVTVAAPPGDLPEEGSVELTLAAGGVTDLASLSGPAAPVLATAGYAHDDTPPTVALYRTPKWAASNAEFFDWTAVFSEPVTGFEVTDLVIGGPAGATWSIKRVLGAGTAFNFTTSQAVLSNGTFTLHVPEGAVEDLAGNPLVASDTFTMIVDRSAPTTSTPTVALLSNKSVGATLPASILWSGADVGPAGIWSYDVARSSDGQAFQTIATGLASPALGTWLTPGHTYRFEVRARDKANNVGPWKAGPTLTPALTQQTSSAVHWAGSTVSTSYPSYSGGSERYLASAGASASYTTTARSLSFVTTKGTTRGQAKIYVDGVYQATVDLNASASTFRFVAYTRTWSSVGTHTIKVVAVGTPGHPRVDVDAFGVIR